MSRVSAVVLVGVFLVLSSVVAAVPVSAKEDYSSFFWQRELEGAGWARCEQPLTWSVDVTGLSSRQSRAEIARLKQAWQAWSDASGVAARFVGRESLDFDPGTNGLRRPDGSPQPDRHVYIAFKTQRQVPIMVRGVIGLAKPAVVLLPSREIIAGVAVFRRSYILEGRKADPDRVMHLYLHELGHVMGLGHAGKEGNVMYPRLDHLVELGTGDEAGVDHYTQTCTRLPDTAGAAEVAVHIRGWWE